MAFDFFKNMFNNNEDVIGENDNPADEAEISAENMQPEEIDEEIEELLAKDEKVELTDINYDYIKDVSVYDKMRKEKGEDDDAGTETPEEDKKEPVKASPFMVGIFVTMSALVIVAVIGLIVAVKIIGNKHIDGDFQGDAVSQNRRSVSTANYIFIDNTQPFGDNELTLNKILVDAAGTIFYFDGELDVRDADFTLIDDKDNNYSIDLASWTYLDFDNGSTKIRFEPLKRGINAVKLTVRGLNTGNEAVFDVIFDKPVSLPKMAHLKDKSAIKYRDDEYQVKVNYLEYSGAGSRIEYIIENNEENIFDIVQKQKNNGEAIVLKENTGKKLKIWRDAIFHTFNDGKVTLGRLDFSPLDNISGTTQISIENLYKKYDVDIKIPAFNLPQGESDESAETVGFDIENYKVVFEGLKGYDEAYYLVLHCEDKNLEVDPEDEYANRKEVLLDANLIMGGGNGMQIDLEGTSTAAEYGTDMIFPINEMTADLIKKIPRNEVVLDISAIYIGIEDAEITLEPKELIFSTPYLRNSFESTIKDAFYSRLNYKSGEIEFKDIEGFSDLVKDDKNLMENYKPLENINDLEKSVQIVALDVENDDFYAIVMESMKYKQNKTPYYFYRTHKIIGKRSGNVWLVDSDKIVS